MLYFLDSIDGDNFCPDEEGVELATLADAQELARCAIGEMAKEAAMAGGPGRELAIEVRDVDDYNLFRASVWFEVSGLV